MNPTTFASPNSIGFGTYRLKCNDVRRPLREAIYAGYRHIDTAGVYKNEVEIGETLQELEREGVVKREELYITSKLCEYRNFTLLIACPRKLADVHCEAPYDMGEPQKAFDRSLDSLQISYLDQYLIHWPGCSGKPGGSPAHAVARKNAWRVLVAAQAEGRVRNIGVSNYTAAHLRDMIDGEEPSFPFPHILQMEFHPLYWQVAMQLREEFGLEIEGYAVLGEGRFANPESCSPAVQTIAKRLGATTSQVILGWALRKGVRVLVMSRNPQHLSENLAAESVAALMSTEDDVAISGISSAGETKFCWDPATVS